MKFEQVTFMPRYPSFSYFLLQTGQECKVLHYEDHLEIYATDRTGRWRPRRTLPRELAKCERTLRKYDLTLEPRATDGNWVRDLPGTPTRVADLGPVSDPAFMPREPNPVVLIHAEDGRLIYRACACRCHDDALNPDIPAYLHANCRCRR